MCAQHPRNPEISAPLLHTQGCVRRAFTGPERPLLAPSFLPLIPVCAAGPSAGTQQSSAPGSPAAGADAEPPEERFAFALSDGRVGVLAVRGRKARASARRFRGVARPA